MPLAFATAPIVADNFGSSDTPLLCNMACNVKRGTQLGKFASKFRSRVQPVSEGVGKEILSVYRRFRESGARIATPYLEAMPFTPPTVQEDRARRFESLQSRWSLFGPSLDEPGGPFTVIPRRDETVRPGPSKKPRKCS
jgi:hypothetical protein